MLKQYVDSFGQVALSYVVSSLLAAITTGDLTHLLIQPSMMHLPVILLPRLSTARDLDPQEAATVWTMRGGVEKSPQTPRATGTNRMTVLCKDGALYIGHQLISP